MSVRDRAHPYDLDTYRVEGFSVLWRYLGTFSAQAQTGRPIVPVGSEQLLTPQELVRAHQRRLHGLRLESGYGESEFGSLIEAVIEGVSEYVHVLPATRSENHSEAGGLLRLAIESAGLAFRRAEGQFLSGPVRTDVRNRDRDRAWRYAIFVAALLRPIGRSATHLRVSRGEGGIAWDAFSEGLWPWLQRQDSSEMHLQWRNGTDGTPDYAAASWIGSRIVPSAALAYLAGSGDGLTAQLVQMTLGARVGRASEIVEEAYQATVEQDLSRVGRMRESESAGLSIEQRVVDAMRTLIREKWTLNTPGGRVWFSKDGVFLAWAASISDVTVRLRAEGIRLGHDPNTLAEMLVARGVLAMNPAATGSLKHFYRIVPQVRGVPKQPLEVVRLADLQLLGFQAEGVEAVEIEFVNPRLDAPLAPAAGARPVMAIPELRQAGARRRATPSVAVAAKSKSLDLPFAPTPLPEPAPSFPETVAAGEQSTQTLTVPPAVEALPATAEAAVPSPEMSADLTNLERLLQFGEAGATLHSLGRSMLERTAVPGLVFTDEGLALAYPQAIAAFCDEPRRFLAACESQGLLVAEKGAGGRIVRERPAQDRRLPERFIVLSARVARFLPRKDANAAHN